MGTWRGTGRRALAVGAGALLISALGAGPAYAGSDNDDDDYVYVDDSCTDYHYSWYYEHGYDYDEHWDHDWDHDWDHGDHDRWKDHVGDWDENKDDWKKYWDPKYGFYLNDGKVYDKTGKAIFDLRTGRPISVPDTASSKLTDAAPAAAQADKQADAAKQQAEDAAKKRADDLAKQAEEDAKKQADDLAKQAEEAAKQQADDAAKQADETAKVPQQQSGAESGNPGKAKPESTIISPDGSTSTTTVEQNAVVTGLAAGDRKDDDKDHDWDRDHDRDHGWWDGWWEKESYSVDVSCYEDKETNHRWYDDRPVGEIDATEVKTVPKGGVDTGN